MVPAFDMYILICRDRFKVAMTLDGKTYLRMNHLDLDIFLETTIDGHIYILHCFREANWGNVAPRMPDQHVIVETPGS